MAKKDKHTDHDPDNGRFVEGNQAHTLRENPGRPSKLPRFLQAFAGVLDDPHPVGNAIILTDKELVFLANQRLEFDRDRVDDATLSRWKKYEFTSEKDQQMAEEFRDLYERAMIQQKQALFRQMAAKDEKRSWNRWMSIIERKFDDWNLRHKQVDETPDRKQLVFRVAPEQGNGKKKTETDNEEEGS